MYGVYRIYKNGARKYVSRTVTQNQKLASEIADGLSRGEITMPDGSIRYVAPRPHIAALID